MNLDDTPFELRLARTPEDLIAAQRLRYTVFVQELGGNGPLVDHTARLERDEFDPYFDHLLLIDPRRDASALEHVVGVYRMLTGEAAEKIGKFYSEGEYDLSQLRRSGRRVLELGRSCVHPDYRGGTAMHRLWSGLARYVIERKIEILFGVASFHGTDVQAIAEPLSYLHHQHLAPADLRVRARPEQFQRMDLIPAEQLHRSAVMKAMPALIKAYLRLGGFVGEGAYIDWNFNTIDVCLLMDTTRMNARQKDRYTRGARHD